MRTKVSIIILNWNGKKFLKNCLISLKKVNYQPLEIIVVDNHSSDGSQDYVKRFHPQVKLIENRENYGFAKGNNLGFKAASGDYLLFLNNDTQVTPDFLKTMMVNFQKDSLIGCVQPQMRVMDQPNLIDEVGAYLTATGFLYHFGYRKDYRQKKYQKKRTIFSAKGACLLIPRKVLKKTGLFDEDFFIFFEETDLCFRIWLAGYKVIYEPKSVIYHVVGGDTTDKYKYERRIYLIFKNMNCCYLKNFGLFNFLRIYPFFLAVQLGVIFYFLITLKFNLLKVICQAYAWNLVHFKETLKKRAVVQKKIRKISDAELDRKIMAQPHFPYYLQLLRGLK